MKSQNKFLSFQRKIFKKYGITYYSIDIEIQWNEKEKKIKKKPIGMPSYKDKKVQCKFDENKNGLIIPLGKRYDGLIGVDVDNKNDTINFFNNLAEENDFDLNTLSVKTINAGMHYYFKLTDKQMKELDKFMSSTAVCFTTPEEKRYIDIKYTNQVFFGPTYINDDGIIRTYEVENDCEPVILPEYLFNEILRTHKKQTNCTKNTKKITDAKVTKKNTHKEKGSKKINKNDKMNNDEADNLNFDIGNLIDDIDNLTNNETEELMSEKTDEPSAKKSNNLIVREPINKEKEAQVRLYLNCLNEKRFDDRTEWLCIGAIIYNECKSYELFEEYSKKSKKYESTECEKLWKSFKEERDKKATIKKLIKLAEQDTQNNNKIFIKAIINDKNTILKLLFEYGATDLYLSYLFYNLKSTSFLYDDICGCWYYINEYGMYTIDKNGTNIKKAMDECMISCIKQDYMRQIMSNNNDDNNGNTDKILYGKYMQLCKYCGSKNADNVINRSKLLFIKESIYEKMDAVNPQIIGFENGVYDLEKNILRNAKPEECVSVTTGYNYAKADNKLKEKAMQLLKMIFPDVEELRYMLKHISLGLCGINSEEKVFIYIGNGANGKSLLRDIIQTVLGNYFDTMDISYLYKSNIIRPDAPNPIMARKKNSRFVICTEPEGDVILRGSTIKSLSGNDPQQVRLLYGNSFNFIPKFKLVIQTNTEPVFHSLDGGMKRRIIMITFPNKFVENPVFENERKIDKTLKKKITVDKLYVHEFFEILVEHYKMYLKEGLILPKRFAEKTNEFIRNNDPITEWFETRIEKVTDPKAEIQASELYNNFQDFIKDEYRDITQTFFKNTLLNIGIKQKKKRLGNFYQGIRYRVDNV